MRNAPPILRNRVKLVSRDVLLPHTETGKNDTRMRFRTSVIRKIPYVAFGMQLSRKLAIY